MGKNAMVMDLATRLQVPANAPIGSKEQTAPSLWHLYHAPKLMGKSAVLMGPVTI